MVCIYYLLHLNDVVFLDDAEDAFAFTHDNALSCFKRIVGIESTRRPNDAIDLDLTDLRRLYRLDDDANLTDDIVGFWQLRFLIRFDDKTAKSHERACRNGGKREHLKADGNPQCSEYNCNETTNNKPNAHDSDCHAFGNSKDNRRNDPKDEIETDCHKLTPLSTTTSKRF